MKLNILNPVAQKIEEVGKNDTLAPRLQKLEGKVIGLFWNFKSGGDAALRRTSELLKARYAGLQTKSYVGSIGAGSKKLSKDDVKRIARECEAVIGSTAD